MGRRACCEKVGLKKGQWSEDEDQILIDYIRLHGHPNWRALPKLAGLLRCGKSCRLRWTNYLKPDIKRGNFTSQEEDTIIHLHQLLGNKWSTIAAKLPGRTDNEIKNVWHSHLKKRLQKSDTISTTKRARKPKSTKKDTLSKKFVCQHADISDQYNIENNNNNNNNNENNKVLRDTLSPQPCSSEMSTITSFSTNASESNRTDSDNTIFVDEISEEFWSEVLSLEDTTISTDGLFQRVQYDPFEPKFDQLSSKVNDDDVDIFWFNLLTRFNDHELPEIV